MQNEPNSHRKSFVPCAGRRNHEPKRTQATQAGSMPRPVGRLREMGFLGKTCSPTIIVSDVARALAVKCFVYNETSREMGLCAGGFTGAARRDSPNRVKGAAASSSRYRHDDIGAIMKARPLWRRQTTTSMCQRPDGASRAVGRGAGPNRRRTGGGCAE